MVMFSTMEEQMIVDTNKCCTACGSQRLVFGYTGNSSNAFVPSNIFVVYGFRTRSYVCLDCGHVSQFISKEKLDKLKSRIGEREELEE